MDNKDGLLLKLYRDTLDQFAIAAHRHIGGSYGDELDGILSNLQHVEADIETSDTYNKIIGRGPTSTLKVKLGLTRNYGRNLLKRIPDEHKASIDNVLGLLTEFIHRSDTHLGAGGELTLKVEDSRELPERMSDVKEGLYYVRSDNKVRPVLVLQCIGANYGFVIVSLPRHPQETVNVQALNYVEEEGEWVNHNHFGVFSRSSLRTGFLGLLKKLDYILPLGISQEEMFKTVRASGGTDNVEFNFHDIHVVITRGDSPTFRFFKGDKEHGWGDLTTVKQKQLLEELQKRFS